jgi:hypothetical protein
MLQQMTIEPYIRDEGERISNDFNTKITNPGVQKLLFQPSFAHFNNFIEALISNPQGTPQKETSRGTLKQK